jgi:8-oxo-dGTP diphosphatase
MQDKKIINVAAGIVEKDGKYLLCQRGPGRTLENLWEIPGGKVEEGDETLLKTVQRELQEELSLRVAPISKRVYSASYDYSFGTVRMSALEVATTDVPQLTEHVAYAFVGLEDLLSYDLAPVDIPILEEFVHAKNRR